MRLKCKIARKRTCDFTKSKLIAEKRLHVKEKSNMNVGTNIRRNVEKTSLIYRKTLK